MKCFAFLSALALFPGTLSATIYMAGDSTMAKGGGGSGTDGKSQGKSPFARYIYNALVKTGWGLHIAPFVSGTVSNQAVAGRSARSYTREQRFQAIADVLKPGDYVVIEFGHNDGGSLRTDNGRTDCPGSGDETGCGEDVSVQASQGGDIQSDAQQSVGDRHLFLYSVAFRRARQIGCTESWCGLCGPRRLCGRYVQISRQDDR